MSTNPAASGSDVGTLIEQLRTLWMTVLDTSDVRPGDNFIESGGDSISATLCVNRIRASLGVDVSVLALLAEDASFDSFVRDVNQAISSRL